MGLESELRAEVLRARELPDHADGGPRNSLQKLYHWLKWEGLTSLFAGTVLFIPWSSVFVILTIAAIVFTPYLLWHLAKAGWYRAILLFGVFVILPFIFSRFVPEEASLGAFLLMATPLVFFYIFNWILRLIIGEYLEEERAVREMHRRREAAL
jgi:hypothetical protein